MLRSSDFQKEMTQHFLIKHLSPIDIFLLSLAFSSLLSCYLLPCSTSLHLTLSVSHYLHLNTFFFLFSPFSLSYLYLVTWSLAVRDNALCIGTFIRICHQQVVQSLVSKLLKKPLQNVTDRKITFKKVKTDRTI